MEELKLLNMADEVKQKGGRPTNESLEKKGNCYELKAVGSGIVVKAFVQQEDTYGRIIRTDLWKETIGKAFINKVKNAPVHSLDECEEVVMETRIKNKNLCLYCIKRALLQQILREVNHAQYRMDRLGESNGR